jgi:hypothetical protein
MSMYVSDQLVPCANDWTAFLIPVEFNLRTPNAINLSSIPAPNFVLTFLPQDFLVVYSHSFQVKNSVNYVRQPDDERIVRSALDSLNQLFACQPGEVIEAFETYLSPSECYVDGPWNGHHQEIVTVNAVSGIPRDRQVRIETAAEDHILHLQSMILAEEQEAPTATAVGQILTSGGKSWMKWKKKLLHSLSRCSRNLSLIGFQIALADAVQASSY